MPRQFTVQLTLKAEAKESGDVTLLDMSAFLYDFNLLYEISRLATDSRYADFHFSPAAYYRQGRPLRKTDRLQVTRIRYGSPLEIVAVTGALGGATVAVATTVWLVIQAVEKIANFRLNRKKLQAEIAKLAREEPEKVRVTRTEHTRALLERREALETYNKIVDRLLDSDVRVVEISLRVVRGDPGED